MTSSSMERLGWSEMTTVAMPVDSEFELAIVKSAEKQDGGWSVLREDGWSLWLTDNGIEPEPGDVMRCYGRGIGYSVRGIAIEGKGIIRYLTKSEERAEFDRQQAERKKDQRAKEIETRPDRDLRVRELPRALRLRAERFQNARDGWRAEHEPYELFVCEEAAKIAAHFEGENAIYRLNEWAEKPFEAQMAEVAVSDGHSGNTFGATVHLARLLLLENDEDVIRAHGALCPLTGCKDYGCYAADGDS